MTSLEKIIEENQSRFKNCYIECCEGWKELIESFLLELEKVDPENTVAISCIKEKFGFLTIYFDFPVEFVECDWDPYLDLTVKYTHLSKHVCEICGKMGKLRVFGTLLKTTCEDCKILFNR